VSQRFPLLGYPAYVRFWLADAVSMVGSSVTGLARWLPYLLFGLLAGAADIGVTT
jgi:hypothetical protein